MSLNILVYLLTAVAFALFFCRNRRNILQFRGNLRVRGRLDSDRAVDVCCSEKNQMGQYIKYRCVEL